MLRKSRKKQAEKVRARETGDLKAMQFPILLHDDECGLIMTVSAVAHDDLHKQPSFSCQPPSHQRIALHHSEQFHVVVLREEAAAAACKGLVLICDKCVPKVPYSLNMSTFTYKVHGRPRL